MRGLGMRRWSGVFSRIDFRRRHVMRALAALSRLVAASSIVASLVVASFTSAFADEAAAKRPDLRMPPHRPRFVDVTEDAGVAYIQHTAREVPNCIFLQGTFCEPERMSGGAAVGDVDGDGVVDGLDNCPSVFNPPRPVDGFAQGDADFDGIGDQCDFCPLDFGEEICTALFADGFEGGDTLAWSNGTP